MEVTDEQVWEVLADTGSCWRTMPDMNASFRQFASGLKQQAEAAQRPAG